MTPEALGLGMNDVTILAPLPSSGAVPVLVKGSDLADDGTVLVPRALYDRVVMDPERAQPLLSVENYARLHLVAVRFDLCDRHQPGVCPEAEDARLRLVFQPVWETSARDVGFHAFYVIRHDEIEEAIAALRALGKAAPPPRSGPLRVSPALAAPDAGGYAAKLRALVRRYGGEARLVRLTMNAQSETSEQLRWALRGVERKDDGFVEIPIVGASGTIQTVIFANGPSYDVTPASDRPAGIVPSLKQGTFDSADAATKAGALTALVAVENPLSHTAETVACFACHVSTVLIPARAPSAAIDPLTLPGRYPSPLPGLDLGTTGGKLPQTPGTVRALGYTGTTPLISQRVVNETAQTLAEIAARYPAP